MYPESGATCRWIGVGSWLHGIVRKRGGTVNMGRKYGKEMREGNMGNSGGDGGDFRPFIDVVGYCTVFISSG